MAEQSSFKDGDNGSTAGNNRIGVYVCHCGTNIGGVVDVPAVAEFAAGLPEVVVARDYTYMCSDPGQAIIQEDIQKFDLTRVVVGSCSPLMHESTFRRACQEAGLNPFYFQMTNLREHVAWGTFRQSCCDQKGQRLDCGCCAAGGDSSPFGST